MTNLTDPALEIADLCDLLNEPSNVAGDKFLAKKFGVEPWSAEFFEILFAITKRISSFPNILEAENVHSRLRNGANEHLRTIAEAFSQMAMSNPWNAYARVRIGPSESSPIRMLSAAISTRYSYPDLTAGEHAELLKLVADLKSMLIEHQLGERDFIRQALIEGLDHFEFRVTRLKWFGWGYSVQSLREVLLAYFALERGLDEAENPQAGAVFRHLSTGLKKIFQFTKQAKDASDAADWAFTMLKAATKFGASGGSGYIAGLLTHG